MSLATALVLMIGSIVGFVVTLALNTFVLDKFNAYGEVPIPGSSTLHFPAGEITVSFHTLTIGSTSGGGLPTPDLTLGIDPPPGVAQPKLTENYGVTTTVNNDAHIRVWVMQVPAEGDYKITTEGKVNGYISPQLAFGHGGTSSVGTLMWMFGGLFVVGLIGTIASGIWRARTRVATLPAWRPTAEPLPAWQPTAEPLESPMVTSTPAQLPTDEGVKLEQLKTLAALRDSGALTEDEFQAEKRRILDGR
jgi:Short C-terminal domain